MSTLCAVIAAPRTASLICLLQLPSSLRDTQHNTADMALARKPQHPQYLRAMQQSSNVTIQAPSSAFAPSSSLPAASCCNSSSSSPVQPTASPLAMFTSSKPPLAASLVDAVTMATPPDGPSSRFAVQRMDAMQTAVALRLPFLSTRLTTSAPRTTYLSSSLAPTSSTT